MSPIRWLALGAALALCVARGGIARAADDDPAGVPGPGRPFRYASIVACQRPRVSSITPSGRTRAAAP